MSSEIAVTDSHALIWYARKQWRLLGTRARRVFERAEARQAAIYVPVVALVEVLEAARLGVLRLVPDTRTWTHALFASGSFFPIDLTTEIVLRAEALYGIPERGDRLIAATAVHLGWPLLTRDPEIGRIAEVRVIW